MNQTGTGGMHERLRRNTLKLAGWTAAWVITLAIATFGPVFLWEARALTAGPRAR